MKTRPLLPILSIFPLLSIFCGSPAATAQESSPAKASQAAKSPAVQSPSALPKMNLELTSPYYPYDKGKVIKLQFSQQIVKNKQIGKPVDPSIWAVVPNFEHHAYWASNSEIALILNKDFSYRQKAHFELKPELRSLEGHRLAKDMLRHSIQNTAQLSLSAPYSAQPYQAILLGCINPEEAALLKAQLAHGQYKIIPDARGEEKDAPPSFVPITYRPLRLEDLLNNEEASEEILRNFTDWEQLRESLLAQQKKQAGGTKIAYHPPSTNPTALDFKDINPKSIIPGFWYIYPYLELKNRQSASVLLPLMGNYNLQTKLWEDKLFAEHQTPSAEFSVSSNRPVDKAGKPYIIKLHFSIPLAAAQLESSLSKLQWQLNKSTLESNEKLTSLSYEPRSQSYRAEIEGKTYELFFDKSASKSRSILQMEQGKEVAIEVYDSLQFTLQTYENPLRITCQAELELLNGEKTELFVPSVIPVPKIPDSTPASEVGRILAAHQTALRYAQLYHYNQYAELCPQRPYLNTEASLNGIMQKGNQSIPCRYHNLKNVRASITRIDASPQHAAQAIALYKAREELIASLPKNASSEEYDKWAAQIKASPLAGHPAILSTSQIELPEGSHHISINLRDSKIKSLPKSKRAQGSQSIQSSSRAKCHSSTTPSADSPAVLYLLEITGNAQDNWHAANPEHKNAGFYNRSLIQISNLGLLWKKSKKKIYLYPYQLSDGKAPAKTQAYFLDAEGRSLGSHCIMRDGQSFPLDEKLAYISIQQGSDRYSVDIRQEADREKVNSSYSYYTSNDFENFNIDSSKFPITRCFIFTERDDYRPGEDVYIKGIIRSCFGNQLRPPSGIENLKLNIKTSDGLISSETLDIQADGSFSSRYSLPKDAEGYYRIESIITFKGDDDKSSPDMQQLQALLLKMKKLKRYSDSYELRQIKENIDSIIKDNRKGETSFRVEEFRRPEFKLHCKAEIKEGQNQITLQSHAQQYTGVPLSHAPIKWYIHLSPSHYKSPKHEGYRFGSSESKLGAIKLQVNSKLDSEGKSSLTIPLPKLAEAKFRAISLRNVATNEQQITRQKSIYIESQPTDIAADIAIGIKLENDRSNQKRGNKLHIKLRSINRADEPCLLPSPMKISVIQRNNDYSLQGMIKGQKIHKHQVETVVYSKELLPSKPDSSIELPLIKAGEYIIRISGVDAKNRRYLSTEEHRVYDYSYNSRGDKNNKLSLSPDKKSYRPGDIARITLKNPVNAEVICSIEREDILRHSRHRVSPENPIIEIPIEEGDAPVIHINAFIIESRKSEQQQAQPPLIKMGYTTLCVDSEKQKLSIELHKNKESIQPQEELKIRGQVRDYQGKAVPKAHITLYAVDEAILTRNGKADAPDPLGLFNASRPLLVRSYSSQNHTLEESLKLREYNNHGNFIGEGKEPSHSYYGMNLGLSLFTRSGYSVNFFSNEGEGGLGASASARAFGDEANTNILRRDFRPVAYWLGYQQSDAQGQFEIQYKSPDTLTRYRIIALANDGKDKFGESESHYEVAKAVMLEANAPKVAVQGDQIDIPLSITLRLDKMEGIELEDITWSIRAEASKGISIAEKARKMKLPNAGPHQVIIPIEIVDTALGKASITWIIEGHLSDGTRIPYADKLLSELNIRPNLPLLRENILLALPAGKDIALLDSIRARYLEPIELELKISPSPLTSFNKHIASIIKPTYYTNISRCIPYIIADELIRYTGLPAATLAEGSPASSDDSEEEINQQSPPNLNDMLKNIIQEHKYDIIRNDFEYTELPSSSTTYALLILQLAQDKGKLPADTAWLLEMGYIKIKDNFKLSISEGSHMTSNAIPLSLYCLARANQLSPAEFDLFLAQQKKNKLQVVIDESARYHQFIALIARLIEHPQAEVFHKTALDKAKKSIHLKKQGSYNSHDRLPSLRTLQMLEHIARAPQDPELLPKLLIVLRELEDQTAFFSSNNPSLWELAWHYLLLERYFQAVSIAHAPSAVQNGEPISNSQPQIDTISSMSELANKRYRAMNGSLYAIGSVEGYRTEALRDIVTMSDGTSVRSPQSNRAVSAELSLSRSYERALPTGQWEATSSPQVGDVIRITLKAARNNQSSIARSITIVDSLPACMESLEVYSYEPGYHGIGRTCSTHGAQFTQPNDIGLDSPQEFIYHARVTKSGSVSAPPAKIEFSHKPSIFALTAPQRFEIKAKESAAKETP